MNLEMSERNWDFQTFTQPAPQFDLPNQVSSAEALSRSEKRAILSAWASDANAAESKPRLRRRPETADPVFLAAVLEALRRLDDEPPPKARNEIPRRHIAGSTNFPELQ